MDTPEDHAREEGYAALAEEISVEAIDEFTFDKLRSYYEANPDLAVDSLVIYQEANSLLETSPSASLILFTTAIEIGLKVTILKPVIYGLVHNESTADLISELAVKHNGFDRIKGLIESVLSEYANIDLKEFQIDGHTKTIWQEIAELQKARNAVVHRGELATKEVAQLAASVATIILGMFLPETLKSLGFELKQGFKIGNA